ncbi:hypothetical protein SDC9_198825 [bioreactor metagenome]|uniref:Uncharacterized protein n=1 Tax=bioreactor metagenome TaxID=1076179 RepID=A0A645IVH4_9ZZZZ
MNFKQGGFRDIDVPLANQGGGEAVEHGENQGADLEAVHVAVGADDHLVPPEVPQIKLRQILYVLVLHLDAAAQHLHQVGNDFAFENPGVIRLQAV